ncbi:MAG TPA: ABC transporter permease [Candidatus Acidoferrales bacterium]|nr:ABC transporter permease [Candidatus Acidoferrales bacterium]
MSGFWQDVKYGVRMLEKSPGFTATAVITLALAIGANTAVFSVVDPLLLRKLPVEKPDELVLVGMAGSLATNNFIEDSSYAIFRDNNRVFSGIGGSTPIGFTTITRNGADYQTSVEEVTGSYFPVLGVQPSRGRLIAASDDRTPGGNPVAVLSFDFWIRAFGGDDKIIGQTIPIRNLPFVVIGVAPREFFGIEVGRAPGLFVPMAAAGNLQAQSHPGLAQWFNVFGRLNPGESITQASVGLQPLFETAVRESTLPEIEKGQDMSRLALMPLARGLDDLRAKYSASARIVVLIVLFVLLIGCSNVANLLIARGISRRRELTVRYALGAGRARLLRQLLTESALLAIAGGAVGVVTAIWTSRALVASLSTRGASFALKAGINGRVLAYTAIALVLATIIAGFAPAVVTLKRELLDGLKAQPSEGSDARKLRLPTAMMIGQISVSMTILASAGLLAHSLVNLETFDVGFDRNHLIAISFFAGAAGRTPDQAKDFYERLTESAKGLPGVRSATVSGWVPVSGNIFGINVSVEGHEPRKGEQPHVFFAGVSPGYFGTLDIPLLEGRDFSDLDKPDSPRVAILNRTMARHYFGEESAIGKRFRFVEGNWPPMEIVGVVADSTYNDLRETTPDFLYVDRQQFKPGAGITGTLSVRTVAGPAPMMATMVALIHSLDPSVHVTVTETMKEWIDESLHQDRLVAALSGGFSLLALVLTAVGLFGVLAFSVARRTGEIGVRMALGARPADIFRLIVGNGMTVVAIGLAIGAAGALAASRLLKSILFHVGGADPVALGAVTIVLLAAAFLACYLPARRASRVDPMAALRSE